MFFYYLDQGARSLVLLALIYAALVALTHWAVRRRSLTPFGPWPRFVRRISDPVLLPLERRLVRAGASPQNAPYWLLGVVVAVGLVLLSLTQWLIGMAASLTYVVEGGPRAWARVLLSGVFTLLMTAILIRVIGSWFGIGPYRRWMRPFYTLTDWLIEPLRRVLPTFGPFDLSPLVAWVVLAIVRNFVLQLL
jgi:YggT family protein